MTRDQQTNAIASHMFDPNEMSDFDVSLLWELVFALTWSHETNEFAKKQMEPIFASNEVERLSHKNG